MVKARYRLNKTEEEIDLQDYGCDDGVDFEDLSEDEKENIKDVLYENFIANGGLSIELSED